MFSFTQTALNNQPQIQERVIPIQTGFGPPPLSSPNIFRPIFEVVGEVRVLTKHSGMNRKSIGPPNGVFLSKTMILKIF
jgi:hypothetical protein